MSKRSGERCKGPAIFGSRTQKCRMHGGAASIGMANPGFKHGRYSRFLPAQMAHLYQEALNNPQLLEMADHIALLESRIQKILADNQEGDPVPRWSEVLDLFESLYALWTTGDKNLIEGQMLAIQCQLRIGARWDTTWNQIAETMEQLRKMTDTEVKRKRELNQMVPIERVMILMAAVGDTVKRNVKDPAEIQAIHRELNLILMSDRVPGQNSVGVDRVGPEVIDVSPDTAGVKGGRSKLAKRTRAQRDAESAAPQS